MDVEGFCPQGQQGMFLDGGQKRFPGVSTVIKFQFTNAKLREKHISMKQFIEQYRISKPGL